MGKITVMKKGLQKPKQSNQKGGYRNPVQGNKEERTMTAKQWLDHITLKWNKEVQRAVENTTAYRDVYPERFKVPEPRYEKTETKIFKNDVVTCAKAAVTHASKYSKILVLNFASYTSPGGGFLKGSTAQEEAICYSTGLYPCLESQKAWYEENRKTDTDRCYSNDYIYSEDVPFIVNNKCYFVDVLTMAAPNNKSVWSPVEDLFAERMECAFLVGMEKNIDVILLGAWGCGVFGNDPEFVAKTWKSLTDKYDGRYKEVVHPILDAQMCKVFKDVYK